VFLQSRNLSAENLIVPLLVKQMREMGYELSYEQQDTVVSGNDILIKKCEAMAQTLLTDTDAALYFGNDNAQQNLIAYYNQRPLAERQKLQAKLDKLSLMYAYNMADKRYLPHINVMNADQMKSMYDFHFF